MAIGTCINFDLARIVSAWQSKTETETEGVGDKERYTGNGNSCPAATAFALFLLMPIDEMI